MLMNRPVSDSQLSQNSAAAGGHVALFAQRIAAQQAVEDRLLGWKAAAIDRPHVGIGVQQVHPPAAIDLGAGVVAGELLEELLQFALLPGAWPASCTRRGSRGPTPAATPRRVSARTITGYLGDTLAPMRSLVVKRVTRAVASCEPHCGFRSLSKERFLK